MKRGMNPGARTGVPGKLEHKVPKSFHIFRDMRYTYVSGSEREREREREWESETMKALWLRVLLAFAFAGARLRGLGRRRVEFNFSAEEIPWEKRHGINTRLPPRSKESGPLENYLGHGLTSLSFSLSVSGFLAESKSSSKTRRGEEGWKSFWPVREYSRSFCVIVLLGRSCPAN